MSRNGLWVVPSASLTPRHSKGKMRTAIIFFLLASPVFAQSAVTTGAPAACGPTDVKFDVKLDPTPPPSELPSSKALIYVIEDVGESLYGWITIRVGLDGSWIGANRGNSYFSFAVLPGERHLCANWQSSVRNQSSLYSLTSFTAEAGRIYYFRTQIWFSDTMSRIELNPVNNDEGQYQIAAFPLVASHPKK
jgi:hypothetical protein